MRTTARALLPPAVFFLVSACHTAPPRPASSVPPPAITASANPIVGRVLAIDSANGFVIVELGSFAPSDALAPGATLVTRTDDLQPTARLLVSRQLRGRTLGTTLVSGTPQPGDEVVKPAGP